VVAAPWCTLGQKVESLEIVYFFSNKLDQIIIGI
jgi:hypothetical protein